MRRKILVVRRGWRLPLIVKSLSEDASLGISQASVVDTDGKAYRASHLCVRVVGTAAIAEEYIEGRELYVGVLGNDRLRAFRPVLELEFRHLAPGARAIATEKVKHDPGYQERRGIFHGPAQDLAPELRARIQKTAKRICHTLELDGDARIDFRLSTTDGIPYYIEANPNPEIAQTQEFAHAAEHAGLAYPDLKIGFGLRGINRSRSAN